MNSALERKYKYWNILLITPFNVYPYKRIINLQITGTHTLSLSHTHAHRQKQLQNAIRKEKIGVEQKILQIFTNDFCQEHL